MYKFEPFQKVLVRCHHPNSIWRIDIFSHQRVIDDENYYFCIGGMYSQCIPYNKETKHLTNTSNMVNSAPEYFVEWGDERHCYTADELKSFIETAVIKNKDISTFKVTRRKYNYPAHTPNVPDNTLFDD